MAIVKKTRAMRRMKKGQKVKKKKLGKGAKVFLVFFILILFVSILYLGVNSLTEAINKSKMVVVPLDFEIGGNGIEPGQFKEPQDVAVDAAGNFYVTDFSAHNVQEFDSTGKLVFSFGKEGKHPADDNGPGEFEQPSGIWVDAQGNIYVADTFNHRIQKFDSSGNSLKIWAHSFFGPRAVVGDNKGRIYVVDTGNHKVQVFDTNGNFVLEWGGRGSGAGKFDEPVGCAVDPQGFVYVADSDNNRIQKFNSSGKFVASFKVSTWRGKNDEIPYLSFNQGFLYASNTSAGTILKYDSNGRLISILKKKDGFSAPAGVAADDLGHVYVVEKGNDRVARLTIPTVTTH